MYYCADHGYAANVRVWEWRCTEGAGGRGVLREVWQGRYTA